MIFIYTMENAVFSFKVKDKCIFQQRHVRLNHNQVQIVTS